MKSPKGWGLIAFRGKNQRLKVLLSFPGFCHGFLGFCHGFLGFSGVSRVLSWFSSVYQVIPSFFQINCSGGRLSQTILALLQSTNYQEKKKSRRLRHDERETSENDPKDQ